MTRETLSAQVYATGLMLREAAERLDQRDDSGALERLNAAMFAVQDFAPRLGLVREVEQMRASVRSR